MLRPSLILPLLVAALAQGALGFAHFPDCAALRPHLRPHAQSTQTASPSFHRWKTGGRCLEAAQLRLRGGGLGWQGPARAAASAVSSLAMGGGLATGAALVGAANFFGFAVTVLTNTHFLTDLLGTGAFAVAAIASVVISGGGGDRALISGACVALWSFRLAGFLLMRILSTKTDARLSDAFATTGKTAVFWSLSGLWGFITLLPHSLLTGQATPVPLGPVGYCATAMFVLGWLFESVADAQKWNWKQTAEAKTTFCDTGLWKLSRHPNYFGEITVWVSLFLLAAPGLASAGGGAIAFANWKVCLAALSPAFVSFLLLKVSGVPLAEKRYDERFGTSEPYLAYKARTPLLIPRLPFTSRK